MALDFRLPKLSDDMEEGTVSQWLKREGDELVGGEPLLEVETEKVIVEVESPQAGVLLEILAREHEVVPVDGPLCRIGDKGERPARPTESLAPRRPAPRREGAAEGPRRAAPGGAAPPAESPPQPPPTGAAAKPSATAKPSAAATPLARRVATQLQIDLSAVKGSGIGGRIILADLQPLLGQAGPAPEGGNRPSPAAPPAAGPDDPAPQEPGNGKWRDHPHSPLRRTIARRMAQSKREIPHFYVSTEIDVTALAPLKERLNGALEKGRISVNDLMIKAAALALTEVPELNAHYLEGALRRFEGVHVGFAVATAKGLLTPVVRDCHAKSLATIAAETAVLIGKSRARTLRAEDLRGGTFTVSNLGMHAVTGFSAIIDPPQVGILAIARPVERPAVVNGWVVVRRILCVTLSADHRAVDGVMGAAFLAAFRSLLEKPERLTL